MTIFIEFKIENIEPLRIIKQSDSQKFQYDTVRYIPGSSLRGLIINKFIIKYGSEKFESIKKVLLSDKIRFLNAYPIIEGKMSMMSPKGFCENKTGDNKIRTLLTGEPKEGDKRAKLGNFSTIKKDKIVFGNIQTEEILNINVNQADIFRCKAISSHQQFKSFIVFDDIDNSIVSDIVDILGLEVKIGSKKSVGYGKCRFFDIKKSENAPFEEYRIKSIKENFEHLYMLLLSNTAMFNEYGENCGIDFEYVRYKLGLESLEVETCATSVTEISGINHTWKCRIPAVKMYEGGSVFKLRYSGNLNLEKLEELQNTGIGIRRSEGFGQIVFTDFYDIIKEKREAVKIVRKTLKEADITDDDKEVLKIVAKGFYREEIRRAVERYIVNKENLFSFDKVSASQLGVIMSLISMLKYNNENIKINIENFIKSKENKKTIVSDKYKKTFEYIKNVLNSKIEETLSAELNITSDNIFYIPKKEIFNLDELNFMKLDLIEREIKFNNRRKGEATDAKKV